VHSAECGLIPDGSDFSMVVNCAWQEFQSDRTHRHLSDAFGSECSQSVLARSVLSQGGMGVRRHRDLVAWQLLNRLRGRILAITKRPSVSIDSDFCSQIRRAINSACHNTVEGFYKYRHKELAHSLRIARGEAGEVDDQLEAGKQAGHLTDEEYAELSALCGEALAANAGLLKYLDSDGSGRK
jgi:four helix bundle protein